MDGDADAGTLQRMVDLVDPAWRVTAATPAERGFCRVYRLVVESHEESRECFLKAAPAGAEAGIGADARILSVLDRHTSIPVPAVLGVVDDHPEVPSPFYLMTTMPGEELPYERVGWFPDEALEVLARDVGAALGELHRIDAVDSFGYVDRDPTRTLDGGRPSGAVGDLRVRDGADSWEAYLREYTARELERHADTRFDALTPRLEAWFDERIDRLDGPFTPVLGRNDHGLHNLLVDPESGGITAMLDWAYTLAVPPSFDFTFAAYLFGGAFMSALSGVQDRRDLVRDAMRSGYRSTAPDLAGTVATGRPIYEVLARVRVMNDFDRLAPKLPDGTGSDVADGLRADAESVLGAGGR
jgi:aminoglycoside phosphotransferase (APT) family kinase protein